MRELLQNKEDKKMKKYDFVEVFLTTLLVLLIIILIITLIFAIVSVTTTSKITTSELSKKYGYTLIEKVTSDELDQIYYHDAEGRLYVMVINGSGRYAVGGIVPVLDADGHHVVYSP